MPRVPFICYEPSDGKRFAHWLANELEEADSDIASWLDDAKLTGVDNRAEAVAEAIQNCTCFLYILTSDSAHDSSRCKGEWQRAIRYKKPVVVLQVSSNPPPFRLENRRSIDFTADKSMGLSSLLTWIKKCTTIEGELEGLREQHADAERELEYASEEMNRRIQGDVETLKQQIRRLEEAVEDPAGVIVRVDERISLALERERTPRRERAGEPQTLRFINDSPSVVPRYFQNRLIETEIVAKFLRDPAAKLMTIVGRGGIGKTALVCRVLKALEAGKLPDNIGDLSIAGIIYLAETGTRRINFSNLYNDLSLLVAPHERDEIMALGENPQATVVTKLKALISKLPKKPVIVLLDNFEDLIDRDSLKIVDRELSSAIEIIGSSSHHSIKIIITTRSPSKDLAEHPPAAQMAINLDEGLASPYAETVLREMDADGRIGLKSGSEDLLRRIAEFTRGFPRALEAFFAILSADRDTSIDDLLSSPTPPDRIVKVLVGEAYSRLSSEDQLIMQALAVYGHPVILEALDYLLQPWVPHIDCSMSVKRLVSTHFVRKEGRSYYLHPVDREHALERLTSGDGPPIQHTATHPFALSKLKDRAADYYQDISRPRSEWKTLDDIEPYVNQFELRLEAGSDVSAADILRAISAFLERHGAFQQQLALAESLERNSHLHSNAEEVALRVQSKALWRMGKIGEAVRVLEKLIELLAYLGDEDGVRTESLNRLIYENRSVSYEEKLNAFQGHLTYLNEYQPWNRRDRMVLNHNVGNCLEMLGYLEEAKRHSKIAMDLAIASGEVDSIEAQTHNSASCEESIGDIRKARASYSKALEMAAESRNPLWKANHLSALADCYALDGNAVKAIDATRAALSIRKGIGDLEGQASNTQELAKYLIAAGDLDGARAYCDSAIETAEDLGVDMTSYYCLAARLRLLCGEMADALFHVRRAQELHQIGQTWNMDNLFGSVALRSGMVAEAEKAFRSALEQCDKWLQRSALNWKAHEARGLAIAGMVACGFTELVKESAKSYAAAREILSVPGAVAQRLRDFQVLGFDSGDPNTLVIQGAITGKPKGHTKAQSGVERNQVFFSYSRKDKEWLDRLLKTLAPVIQNNVVHVWHDQKIKAGDKWQQEIAAGLKKAKLGVLLVSPDFLASQFINDEELPYLIEKAEQNQVRLIWVLLKECLYEETRIVEFNSAYDLSKPINMFTEPEVDSIMKSIARTIKIQYLDE